MAQTALEPDEFEETDEYESMSKHDRILNMFLAAGGADGLNDSEVADVVDCSRSYVAQLRQKLNNGDISDSDFGDARNIDVIESFQSLLDASPADDVESNETVDEDPVVSDPTATPNATRGLTASPESDDVMASRGDYHGNATVSDAVAELETIQDMVSLQKQAVDESNPATPWIHTLAHVLDISLSTIQQTTTQQPKNAQ